MSVENLAQYLNTIENPRCGGKINYRHSVQSGRTVLRQLVPLANDHRLRRAPFIVTTTPPFSATGYSAETIQICRSLDFCAHSDIAVVT